MKSANLQKPDTWIKYMWNEWFKRTQVDDINLKIHKVKKQ